MSYFALRNLNICCFGGYTFVGPFYMPLYSGKLLVKFRMCSCKTLLVSLCKMFVIQCHIHVYCYNCNLEQSYLSSLILSISVFMLNYNYACNQLSLFKVLQLNKSTSSRYNVSIISRL